MLPEVEGFVQSPSLRLMKALKAEQLFEWFIPACFAPALLLLLFTS
jgi:hypothetical protein